ncbi:MAG: hypothetical protein A2161_06300 [Candidatus Schekmanbacteria bacterium RBG_13_48_7]|uniref:Protein kinase domain-containing protein n=1 Tax=Candidatus Schekmanbacteria bacterium RBG_13_48_7 TaxID=1817878 RepID=A0A1F7RV26_9BACT|nr:MAG: hypothetical protein A2161_06300 [Candidatus Schekmanbacteria bacterium RBG_13_48_7]
MTVPKTEDFNPLGEHYSVDDTTGTKYDSEQQKITVEKDTVLSNRFRIKSELGRGGMGIVYRATDELLNREVALKLIKPELLKDANALERFRRELILTRSLGCNDIIRVYDIHQHDEFYYFSMEFLEGQSLRKYMNSYRQNQKLILFQETIDIIKKILKGLNTAHEENVVHRDLTPENIFMVKSKNKSRIVLLDFGIAKSFELKSLTRSTHSMGKMYYIAPEIFEGKHFDQKSDIFSAGIIFLEMLLGKLPRVITRLPVPIRQESPEDLNRIILKAIEENPGDRYQSVREFYIEVNNLLSEKKEIKPEKIIQSHDKNKEAQITPRFKQQEPRFKKAEIGVIKDSVTGLEWYVGPDKDTNWNKAKEWVEGLNRSNFAGSGWRMPSREELRGLYQKGVGTRNLDPVFNTTGWWVWSGETDGSSSACSFNFNNGGAYWGNRSLSNIHRVFAVRSR